MAAGSISLPYRRYALGLLVAVNLLNYIDRQVLFAVFPLIKIDLRLSDTALGFLGSAFMLSYLLLAPLFGWLGDHWSRTRLASGGVVVWSLATALAGFAPGYYYAHVPSLGLTTHGLGVEGARQAAADLLRLWIAEKRHRITCRVSTRRRWP